MTTRDLDYRSRRVRVHARALDLAIAKRPGSLAPGERRSVLDILNDMVRGCPAMMYAPAHRQLDQAEGFLTLWEEMLPYSDGAFWADPDNEDD